MNQATTKCLGQNLSQSTYGWKDEPSHSRVPWQNLGLPAFGRKDEPSHLQMPWYKIQVILHTGGRTNQKTNKCVGTKFKSFYLRVEG